MTKREWTDAFHSGDRERAIAAFRAAVIDRTSFDIELRLRIGQDTYRRSACIGAPYFARDGRLEGYVGFCCDISPRQRLESSFRETASKLVSAQEADRSYIGRELHDDLGQRAALLAAKLETLARHPRTSVGAASRTGRRAGRACRTSPWPFTTCRISSIQQSSGCWDWCRHSKRCVGTSRKRTRSRSTSTPRVSAPMCRKRLRSVSSAWRRKRCATP